MARVAVLGMGLLGRGFAENLLEKGHEVRVWNRTASKCQPILEKGGLVGATPAEAVAGADRVHLVLSEDPVVDSVIEQLLPGLGEGTPIIDHSTNLPKGVAERATRLARQGVNYLHAPVFMGPASARNATGLMLVCGDRELLARVQPQLAPMTGKVIELGHEPDKAAKVKLVGNGLLAMMMAMMGDLFRLGDASGLTRNEVLELFESFAPTPAGMGKRVLAAGEGPVGFEVTMARKDVRLMIETAGGPDDLMVLPVVAEALDRAIANGLGSHDIGVFAKP